MFSRLDLRRAGQSVNPAVYKITEVFRSFQGEGSKCGTPCIFVRAAGCDMRCTFCDTKYAWDEGEVWTVAALCDHVMELGPPSLPVVLTGGNPCVQDFDPLVRGLFPRPVWVETQGTVWKPWLLNVDWITLSPKLPSAGPEAWQRTQATFGDFVDHLQRVAPHRACPVGYELKMPIRDATDLRCCVQLWRTPGMGAARAVTLQPVTLPDEDPLLNYRRVLSLLDPSVWDGLGLDGVVLGSRFRLLPQIHRLIWAGRDETLDSSPDLSLRL
ncbi:MAG TPA: 7-carboxy-7-deazaguanine synthase QueE [Bacillota bacterium]|nr:7-carboxy-7-deazaguanine synthase QueE [Bacillota bacterium]